jgi:hypothetical protein
MKLPCHDCIVLAICKNSFSVPKNHSIGPFLTSIGFKCSYMKEYMTLADLGLRVPNDDTPMAERAYYNIPQAKRIVELCDFMGWSDNTDISFYAEIADEERYHKAYG